MVFFRFACLVAALCLACYADTTHTADTVRGPGNEWSRLDRQSDYPPCYSGRFIDSLAGAKQFSPAFGLRSLDSVPWARGEKFVYNVSWGPFSAGYVILETAVDSQGGQVVMSAKGITNGFFSAIYKVRDYIRTTMDPKGVYPFFFEQHLREGRYKADRWELFDQTGGRVFTHNNDTLAIASPQFVQNYFSLIDYVRVLSFAPGDSFFCDCFVNTKSFRIVSRCVERKPVQVEAGTFNCLLVKPVLVGEGRVFSKKDEVRLWLTDDGFKMPVMVSAKIRLGSITARLIWYERKE